MSDHKGADLIYPMLPDAETLIADKGYDSDAFREALAGRGIVSAAPQSREHVRKAKRLAAYLNALRPLRPHILQRYLHRGNRYLLARSMSPDPSHNCEE
jgi:IS5 family transposase